MIRIKMFGFIKKIFSTALLFLSSLVSTTPLSCISMINQYVKQDQKLLILIVMSLYFILLVLKQVNILVVVIISMIHRQKYVFLMLEKI